MLLARFMVKITANRAKNIIRPGIWANIP